MTVHICRDLITEASTMPSSSMYLASIFMLHVLRYTYVGDTAFNLTGSLMVATGSGGSINFGTSGSTNAVGIPSASYIVSAADVGRVLALRSAAYPRYNSGLFRISSIDGANNRCVVDYRSSEAPPAETNALEWAIFTRESLIQGESPYTTFGGTPVGSGYTSMGAYTEKRLVLQSPHSSSWQVRFCYESATVRTNLSTVISVAPGFGGNSAGDFYTGSFDTSRAQAEHLHGPMWFDTSATKYVGTIVGIESANSAIPNAQVRFYAWGDDVSGSAVFMHRNVANYANGWYSFGMAEEDEELPPLTSQRLFVFGRSALGSQAVTWKNGNSSTVTYGGMAYGLINAPVSCVWSLYDYVGSVGGTGIKAEATAVDCALLGATELQKVDLWAGTHDSGYDDAVSWPERGVLRFDPRRIGSMPLVRVGRTNFGDWTLTTDANRAWFHATNGVYMPWQGPAILA